MPANLRLTEDQARVIIDRLNRLAGRPAPAPLMRRRAASALQPSRLEIMFRQQLAVLELPPADEQFEGAVPGRKYRLDFAWPDSKVCVEIQGMVHRIKGRFKADTEKICLLVLHGWKVLPVCGDDVRSGRAAAWITTLLEARNV